MFVPSYHYKCKMCGKDPIAFGLICDECNALMEAGAIIENGGINKTDGLPNDNILLDTYYKRDIKISFSHNEQKNILYYTAMMIPNKDNWLEDKMKDAEAEMKKAGFKNVSLKIIGEYWKMAEYEITCFMNDGDHILMTSPYVTLPLTLKNYASGNAPSSRIIWIPHNLWWKILNVFMLVASIFISVFSFLSLLYLISHKMWAGFLFIPIIVLAAKTMYEALIELNTKKYL